MRGRPVLLVVLAIVVITAAWWFFLISPRNGDVSDLEDQTAAAAETETRLRSQVEQLQAIRDREVQYLAAIGRLDALIPESPLLEEFIEEIDQLAIDTGVDLMSLSPSLPAPLEESEMREIVISAQIDGRFFEVVGFLFGLSDMERLVRVDSIAVSSATEEGLGTVLSVVLELRLFTLADLIPLAAVEVAEDGGEGTTGTTTPVDSPTTTEGAGTTVTTAVTP